MATGLAWTESGGDVLYIEASLLPESKGFTLTGQLGEVMQESAKTAQSYIWSHAAEFGIDPAKFKEFGVPTRRAHNSLQPVTEQAKSCDAGLVVLGHRRAPTHRGTPCWLPHLP